MAGELDALGADEDVDAGAVERSAEGVGVQRLAPLVVGLLVAVPAVFCIRVGAGGQKFFTFNGRVSGRRDIVGAEYKIVGLVDLIGVKFAVVGGGSARVFLAADGAQAAHGCDQNHPRRK